MSPALTFFIWGVFLALILTIGLTVWGVADPEVPALLGGAAVVMWLLAAFIAGRRLGVPRLGSPAATPSLSPPSVWLGVSLSLLALSAEVGPWLAYIAGGMVVVGIGGLVRELSAQREAQERAEQVHGAAAARTVDE